MISMLRVDDRLIHGQVAVMWSKQLAVSRIIVANDAIAGNAIQSGALKMAAPSGVKAAVLTIEKSLGILNDPRSEGMKILVLSNNPQDLYEVLKGVEERPVLNLANYGRIGGDLSKKRKITETVYLTPDDEAVIREIHNLGVEVIYQPLPGDPREDFMKLMEGK